MKTRSIDSIAISFDQFGKIRSNWNELGQLNRLLLINFCYCEKISMNWVNVELKEDQFIQMKSNLTNLTEFNPILLN